MLPRSFEEKIVSTSTPSTKSEPMSQPADPEAQPRHESAKKPGKDDVHEQREASQQHEATVSDAPFEGRPPGH